MEKGQGQHRLPCGTGSTLLQRSLRASERRGSSAIQRHNGRNLSPAPKGRLPSEGQEGGETFHPQRTHAQKHQKYLEWSPSRMIQWASTLGPTYRELHRVSPGGKAIPRAGLRSCLGIMRLAKCYPKERLEAPASVPPFWAATGYGSVESILKNGLDIRPIESSKSTGMSHQNIRGNNTSVNSSIERKNMLNVPTMDKLRSLKFHGMLKGFGRANGIEKLPEAQFRRTTGIAGGPGKSLKGITGVFSARLRHASLRQQACVEDIDYFHPRGLDKAFLQSLYSCKWIQDQLNLLITGPTGTGKSFIACALGHQACRKGYRVKYFRIPRFLPQLAIAKGDGSYLKLMAQLAKIDLMILDDWGLSVLNDQQRHDLLEIIDDRHNRSSTIITSQLPMEKVACGGWRSHHR